MRPEIATTFPFLGQLSEPARRTLRELPIRSVRARAPVLRKGDVVEGLFLALDGSFRVFHVAPDGREATLYWVEPGQTCILALSAVFRREPYPAWVEADAAPASYVVVPDRVFRRLLEEPAFREFVFGVLSARVFELMVTLEEAGTLRVEQRIAGFLLRRATDDVVRASQARLAAHLGTAREVVFRALRSLSARGLVKTARGSVRILDRAGLAGLAGHDDDDG